MDKGSGNGKSRDRGSGNEALGKSWVEYREEAEPSQKRDVVLAM